MCSPPADAGWVATIRSTAASLLGERCKDAAVDLIVATQPALDAAPAGAGGQHIRYGASPRALQALIRAARVRAVMAGRVHLDVDDLEAVALPVLRHRILLLLESELDGMHADAALASVMAGWRRRL